MTESPALVLVCKRPLPGLGKQRLVASLGVEKTQRVAEALLRCALEDVCSWPGPVVIAPSSQEDEEWAKGLVPQSQWSVQIKPQTSGNLGQRLNMLDADLRSEGLKQLVYIGSDAPGLTEGDYEAARDALQHYDTVLIPALDGGVVLMGSCYSWPILADLPWSSSQLGAALVNRCLVDGHAITTLKQGFDIDEWPDLIRLINALANDQRPARRTLYQLASGILAIMETGHAKL